MALARRTVHSLGGPTYLPDARVEEALALRRQQFNEQLQQQQLEQAKAAQAAAAGKANLDQQRLALDTWKAQNQASLDQRAQDWLQTYQGGQLEQGDQRLNLDMQQAAAQLLLDQDRLEQEWQAAVLGSQDRRRGQDMQAGTADKDRSARADLQGQQQVFDAGVAGAQIQSREGLARERMDFDREQGQRDYLQQLLRDVAGAQNAQALESLRARNRWDQSDADQTRQDTRATMTSLQDLASSGLSPEEFMAEAARMKGLAVAYNPSLGPAVDVMAQAAMPGANPSNTTTMAQYGLAALGPFLSALPALGPALGIGFEAADPLAGVGQRLDARAFYEQSQGNQANQKQLGAMLSGSPGVAAASMLPQPQGPAAIPGADTESLLRMAEAMGLFGGR